MVFASLAAVTWVGMQLGQISGYQWIAQNAQLGIRVGPRDVLSRVARMVPRLAALAAAVLVRLAVVVLPAVGILALLYFRLPGGHDINFYLAVEPPEWRRTRLLAGLVGVLTAIGVGYLLIRWMLVLSHLLVTGAAPSTCLRMSWQLTAGRGFRWAMPLIVWWGVWGLTSVVFTTVLAVVAGLLLDVSAGRLERTAILLMFLEAFALLVGTALNAVGLAVSQGMVARLHREVVGSAGPLSTAPILRRSTFSPRGMAKWFCGMTPTSCGLFAIPVGSGIPCSPNSGPWMSEALWVRSSRANEWRPWRRPSMPPGIGFG